MLPASIKQKELVSRKGVLKSTLNQYGSIEDAQADVSKYLLDVMQCAEWKAKQKDIAFTYCWAFKDSWSRKARRHSELLLKDPICIKVVLSAEDRKTVMHFIWAGGQNNSLFQSIFGFITRKLSNS